MRVDTVLEVALSVALIGCGTGSASAGGASSAAGGLHPLIGNRAPSFVLDSINGRGRVSIGGGTGRVAVVDFWATWCKACQEEFPRLQELNSKLKADRVDVVGVSEDEDPSGINQFGSTFGADFALVWDSEGAVAAKWSPPNMPTTFVLDRKGVVQFVHVGYHEGQEVAVAKEVHSLL